MIGLRECVVTHIAVGGNGDVTWNYGMEEIISLEEEQEMWWSSLNHLTVVNDVVFIKLF